MSAIAARKVRSQMGLVATIVTLLLIYNSFTGSILYRESYLLFVGLTQPLYLALICLWLLRLRRLKQPLPSTILDTPLLMLGGVILIATLASIAPRLSLNDIPLYFIYGATYYLVVERLRAGWPAMLFLKGLVITAAIVTLLGLLEYAGWYFFGLFSTGQGWWSIGGWRDPLPPRLYRLTHTMFNPNLAGLFLAMVLPLWGAALLSARSGWRRLVLAGLIVANIFVLIVTLSRSALLGAILGGLAFLFLTVYHRNPNKDAVRLPRWAIWGL
ncbi:MAG: hypothetical protein R3264_23525, partial [Anaerolineae bacterium]|nr:hypothetical protein [Anaerolineae bacterium]